MLGCLLLPSARIAFVSVRGGSVRVEMMPMTWRAHRDGGVDSTERLPRYGHSNAQGAAPDDHQQEQQFRDSAW